MTTRKWLRFRLVSKKKMEKAVTGESSMTPAHRERHGLRQDAHAFIQTGSRLQREKAPGPNATCSATSTRAAEKPLPNPSHMGWPRRSPQRVRVRRPSASAFLSGLRPSPRFRVLLRGPALRERFSSLWQPLVRPFHVRPRHHLGINPGSIRFPAGRRQAGKFSFLTFLKRVY
jgi:hypothetical protein